MRTLLNRLREPSTYAGLAGAAVVLGIELESFQAYANAVAGVFGFAAIFLGESKSE